jgi:tripartite-type tricarboxylate transporter receptor subunit TctC
MTRTTRCILLLAFALPFGQSQAQSWPQAGPVTILSSNSAGSTPDIVARMAAQALSDALKQQFIVENKPGGRSVIATVAAARAKPDGYTLYLSGNTAMTANEFLLKNLPYDPDRDFDPVAMVVDSAPLLLSVYKNVPAKTVDELIALAKKSPGKLTYAVSGTLPPIMAQLFLHSAGVKMREVRYKQTSLAVQDTVSGRVDMTLLGLPSLGGYVKDGTVRVLATLSRERSPFLPGVPSINEKFPGIAMEGWFVLLGPKGIPAEVATKADKVLDAYLKKPETLKRLYQLGLSTRGAQNPEAVREFIRSERARWAKVVKVLGIKAQ